MSCNLTSSFLAPKLSPQLNSKNQSEGTYFSILCTVEKGSDPLFFEWSINGEKVKTTPEVSYKIENNKRISIFQIENINRKDSANYGCVVSNQFGSDSQNILLTVKGLKLNQLFHIVFQFNQDIFDYMSHFMKNFIAN